MQEQDKLRSRPRGRFQSLNVVISILIAGWVPVIFMLMVSYTILSNTLESKILRDRQTFVQLIAHLVGDDLGRSSAIVDYYQTYPPVANIFSARYPDLAAKGWLQETYYSHPRIDGMFLTTADGRLIASLPDDPTMTLRNDITKIWLAGARDVTKNAYVSPVHPRSSDGRIATDIASPVHGPDGRTIGFVGVSILVERIGRRLSLIDFADQAQCQIVDQNGTALFGDDFKPSTGMVSPQIQSLIRRMHADKSGHIEENGVIYSSAPIESTGWTTIVKQPRAVAYRPVHDLLEKMTVLATWLIVGTGIIAWLAGKFYRRQNEAAARIEREVTFNDKILANMPSGIALVDSETRRFLQANEAFGQMARRFGNLPPEKEVREATYQEVNIAPADAIEKVLSFGTPFQLIEQPLVDRSGGTNFVNVNLLRLQDSKQNVQGVLYLVEDKTRDVRLRQELISANAAKDQFLALLSHELRNPLSPVIAMVGELEARASESADLRQPLEVIRRNVELEARLIDDLLDVTRIAKGKLQLSFEVTSIHETLRRAYEICREDIRKKNLAFEFRLDAEQDYVSGDPARLQQVFWNLIKNGVKFSSDGGKIVVETENLRDERIAIRVIDSGIGIAPAKIDKVFNAFEQGQSSITRKFGGLGLGLAISKAMVKAHGGTITVESAGVSQGSTFSVVLNTVPAPADVQSTKPAILPKDGQGKRPARKGHLLVVDDHHDTCIGMKMLLERRGYQITLAHTVDQALEKAEAEKFDLLISDIGLPDRSGYELMQELRARSKLRGIAMSGFGMENDILKARAAGFSEHLTKPINFDRLDEAIRSLLVD
ncbi:MAG TPA: ATP-binding protein [Chthoniobacterales bacterium]|nr:ATP-binding protein [Chthoniobacterales bacterium]